jgi:epoxyqueuosine reductase QueG
MGTELGFSAMGFAPVELGEAEHELMAGWRRVITASMDYMARHGVQPRPTGGNWCPARLASSAARLDYLPRAAEPWANLADPQRAYSPAMHWGGTTTS